MKTSSKIASVLAPLSAAFAVGCAAPTDSSGSDSSQRPTKPIVEAPNIDPNDADSNQMPREEIALAREKGDRGMAANLSFGMEDRVQELVNMFDAGGRMAVALERLHLTIAGTGFGEENLIELYRWRLRASGRNLTNAHSESLATGLAFFEEYEALAALLMAECNAAVQYGNDGSGKWPKVTSKTCSRDPRANDRLDTKLEAYIGDQRAKLPVVIPEGMMIDQGPTFGGIGDTTTDKPIYYSIDGNYTFRPTDMATVPGSARHAVVNLNVVGGGTGAWSATVSGLCARLVTSGSPAARAFAGTLEVPAVCLE